jgi:hypothetical protein
MNQLTLRHIPLELEKRLRQAAKQNDSSLNKTVILLLKKILGIAENSKRKRDLSALAGTWDSKQAAEFYANTKHFEKIDSADWEP